MYGGRDYNPPPPFYSPPRPFNHQIHHSTQVPNKHPAENAETKSFNAEWKWLNSSPEAKQLSDAAKAHAFS